jgi:hypothetical protein
MEARSNQARALHWRWAEPPVRNEEVKRVHCQAPRAAAIRRQTPRAAQIYVCVGAFFAGFLYFLAGFFFLARFFVSAANAPSEATIAATGRTTVAPNAATKAAITNLFTGHLHGDVARRLNVAIGYTDKSIGTIPEIAYGHDSISFRKPRCRTSALAA